MNVRFSLFSKILLWFLLSFVLIGGVALLLLARSVDLEPESALRGENAPQIRAGIRLLGQELRAAAGEQWDGILEKFGEAYEVQIILFDRHGHRLAGADLPLPPEVMAGIVDQGWLSMQTRNPDRQWLVVPLPMGPGMHGRRSMMPGMNLPGRMSLVLVDDTEGGRGLFFRRVPWTPILGMVLALSIVFWLPLVRTLTRPIGQMTKATELIAQGRFDVRVAEKRSDEIGRLGKAINDMAARLDRLVSGQKRFLGDVSHELRSPLTRINVALEILEQTAGEKEAAYIRDGMEEVQRMTELVGELMAVARAEVNPAAVRLVATPVRPLVEKVVRRESREEVTVEVDIEPELAVLGDPELLARAVGNLLRNAVRFAGAAGPIRLVARREHERVLLEIRDAGPGVPPEALPHLFEPFFRVQADRSADTGGVGLGLAIVKTCVEACRGTVRAQNLRPRGFAVTIALPPA